MTAARKLRAANGTCWWTRWASCWPSSSPRPMSRTTTEPGSCSTRSATGSSHGGCVCRQHLRLHRIGELGLRSLAAVPGNRQTAEEEVRHRGETLDCRANLRLVEPLPSSEQRLRAVARGQRVVDSHFDDTTYAKTPQTLIKSRTERFLQTPSETNNATSNTRDY